MIREQSILRSLLRTMHCAKAQKKPSLSLLSAHVNIEREGTTGRRGYEAPQQIQFQPGNTATRRKVRLVREHSPRAIGMSIATAKWCQNHKPGAPRSLGGGSCGLIFVLRLEIVAGHDGFSPRLAQCVVRSSEPQDEYVFLAARLTAADVTGMLTPTTTDQ